MADRADCGEPAIAPIFIGAWLPIETAPKGENVLVAVRDSFVEVGMLLFEENSEGEDVLDGKPGDWMWSVGNDWQDETDYAGDALLLGWMPLPQPPNAQVTIGASQPAVGQLEQLEAQVQILRKALSGLLSIIDNDNPWDAGNVAAFNAAVADAREALSRTSLTSQGGN